jgi:hypothetical protein
MLVRDLANTGYVPTVFVMLGLADLASFHAARITGFYWFQAVRAAMLNDCAKLD